MATNKPIIKKFRDVPNGTKYRIFAEPSRDVRSDQVADHTVYEKVCAAWSSGGGKDIILYPNDLVSIVAWPRRSR